METKNNIKKFVKGTIPLLMVGAPLFGNISARTASSRRVLKNSVLEVEEIKTKEKDNSVFEDPFNEFSKSEASHVNSQTQQKNEDILSFLNKNNLLKSDTSKEAHLSGDLRGDFGRKESNTSFCSTVASACGSFADCSAFHSAAICSNYFTNTPQNSAPTIISATSFNIADGAVASTTIAIIIASDSDADTITFSISGTDAASFTIDSSTGLITNNLVLYYNSKTTYTFDVDVDDGNGGSDIQTVTINVLAPTELHVNTLTDESDNNCSDPTNYSLRDAIACATNGNVIYFDLNDTFAFDNGSDQIVIDKNISIIGNGIDNTILNMSSSRYFDINSSAIVSMSNMTFSGTEDYAIKNSGTLQLSDSKVEAVNTGSNYNAGRIYNDGNMTIERTTISGNNLNASYQPPYTHDGVAINNIGTLIISDSNISNNSASISCTTANGGAIYNEGSITISRTTLSNNSVSSSDGAYGGAIYNNSGSTMSISESNITNNTSGNYGGAIYNNGALLNIEKSNFHGNYASYGGAIYTNATSVIKESSLYDNNASSSGGALYYTDSNTTALYNSTVSGNGAPNGGGIYVASGLLNITHSTIAYNVSGIGGGMDSGGGIYNSGGSVYTKNTIIANNIDLQNHGPDIYGDFTSYGYNLITTDQDANITYQASDINGTDPDLNPITLGDSTYLHTLQSTSAAIDSGSCTDLYGVTVTTDQNGTSRPLGSTCDIGAVEYMSDTNSTVQASAILTDYSSEAYLPQTLTLEAYSINIDGSVSKYIHDSNGTKLIYQASGYTQMIDDNATLTLDTTFDYNTTNNRFTSNSVSYGIYAEMNSTVLDTLYSSAGVSGISFPSDAVVKFIHFEDSNTSDVRFNQLAMIYISTFFDANATYIDTDGDGYPDDIDAFPTDLAASIDTDGDGYPDSWNSGKTQSDSTTGLTLDADPNDSNVTTAASSTPTITHIYDRIRRPGFGTMIISFDINDSDSSTLYLDINSSLNNLIEVNSTASGTVLSNIEVNLTIKEVNSSQSGHDGILIHLSDGYSHVYKGIHVEIGSRFDIISNKESNSSAYDSASSNSYTGDLYVLNTYQDYNQSIVEYEKIEVTDSNFSEFIEVKDVGGIVYGIKTETNDLPDTIAFDSAVLSATDLNTSYSNAGMPFSFNDENSSGQKIYIKYTDARLETYDDMNNSYMSLYDINNSYSFTYDINNSYISTYTTLEEFMLNQVKDVTQFGIMRSNDGSRLLVFDTKDDLNNTDTLYGNLIELDENGTQITADAGDWNKTIIDSNQTILSIHPTTSGYYKDMAYVLENSMIEHAEYKSAGDVYSYILLNREAKDEIYSSLSPNPKLSFTLNNGYTYVSLPNSKSLCDSNTTVQTDLTDICDKNNTLESIFGVNTDIKTLFKYTDEWEYWDSADDINASYFMNKFSVISPIEGLLVHATAQTTVNIPFDFEDNQTNTYENMPVEQWIMLSNNKEQSVEEIKTAVEDQNQTLMYIQLYRDPTWHVYAPTNDADIVYSSTLEKLETVKAYESFWIYLKSN